MKKYNKFIIFFILINSVNYSLGMFKRNIKISKIFNKKSVNFLKENSGVLFNLFREKGNLNKLKNIYSLSRGIFCFRIFNNYNPIKNLKPAGLNFNLPNFYKLFAQNNNKINKPVIISQDLKALQVIGTKTNEMKETCNPYNNINSVTDLPVKINNTENKNNNGNDDRADTNNYDAYNNIHNNNLFAVFASPSVVSDDSSNNNLDDNYFKDDANNISNREIQNESVFINSGPFIDLSFDSGLSSDDEAYNEGNIEGLSDGENVISSNDNNLDNVVVPDVPNSDLSLPVNDQSVFPEDLFEPSIFDEPAILPVDPVNSDNNNKLTFWQSFISGAKKKITEFNKLDNKNKAAISGLVIGGIAATGYAGNYFYNKYWNAQFVKNKSSLDLLSYLMFSFTDKQRSQIKDFVAIFSNSVTERVSILILQKEYFKLLTRYQCFLIDSIIRKHQEEIKSLEISTIKTR